MLVLDKLQREIEDLQTDLAWSSVREREDAAHITALIAHNALVVIAFEKYVHEQHLGRMHDLARFDANLGRLQDIYQNEKKVQQGNDFWSGWFQCWWSSLFSYLFYHYIMG